MRIKDFSAAEDDITLDFGPNISVQEQYDTFMAGAAQVSQNVIWSDGTATVLFNRLSLNDLTFDNFIATDDYEVVLY